MFDLFSNLKWVRSNGFFGEPLWGKRELCVGHTKQTHTPHHDHQQHQTTDHTTDTTCTPTHHTTQHHTEKDDRERGQRTRDKSKTREEVHNYMFSRVFFACDGGGAADLPQRVHFLLLAAVSRTFSHVDVTQHVKKCLKLQRETKKDTLWKVNGFFFNTASSPSLHAPFMFVKRQKRRSEDEKRRDEETRREGKRREGKN